MVTYHYFHTHNNLVCTYVWQSTDRPFCICYPLFSPLLCPRFLFCTCSYLNHQQEIATIICGPLVEGGMYVRCLALRGIFNMRYWINFSNVFVNFIFQNLDFIFLRRLNIVGQSVRHLFSWILDFTFV